MKRRILHLCTDGNFIDHSISVFEHFYPNQNTFLIRPKIGGKEATYVKSKDVIWFNPDKDKTYLVKVSQLDEKEGFEIVVVHGMSPAFNQILKQINPNREKRVFWIFWGYELYYSLGEEGKFNLIDNPSPFSIMSYITPTRYNCLVRKILHKGLFHEWLEELLPQVDYFCFWLHEDFELLQKYYPTSRHIKYRDFSYGGCYEKDRVKEIHINFDKVPNQVRVSHNASKTANHVTIMEILRKIDKDNVLKKVFPLSYGSVRVKKSVLRIGHKYFGDHFYPELDYVSSDIYFEELSKVGVAIFGQLRQEAAGNIFPLISYGAKVFLRKQNPLYESCKKNGYIVFSVEDDLKSMEDLLPLTREQMIRNATIALNSQKVYEDFMPHLFDK